MNKFLKLRSILINTKNINRIVTLNNKHYIHIDKSFYGFFFVIFGMIGSDNEIIEVCKIKHTDEYKMVSDWIDKIES